MHLFRGDKYIDPVSKREYPFKKTPDRSDQARALRELIADQQKLRAAADARSIAERGKPLTDREFLDGGFVPPDPRPRRQQITEDAEHTTSVRRDPDANPYSSLLEQLRSDRPLLASDKAQLARKIEAIEQKSNAWEAKRAAHREQAAKFETSEYQTALSLASATLTLVSTRPDVPEALVQASRAALENLEKTGDVAAYYAAEDAIDAALAALKAEKLAALQEQQKQLDEHFDNVRHDRPVEPATTEA